jgi:small subunit ribosomal protein S9
MPAPATLPAAEQAVPEPAEATPAVPAGIHWGTGRRKSAVARVRLVPGTGTMLVNGRPAEQYFTEPQDRRDVFAALELTGVRRHWDVKVNVQGGGHTGQAGAIRLGVSRALLKAYVQFEATLRDAGFLTRDARRVERKKYGQRKARRRFQFSKR